MIRGVTVAAALAVAAACGGDDPPATPAPWSAELPPAGDTIGVRRGLVPARGIIHLHSPLSQDACDGEPRDEDTGAVDEACLADLRAGLCATRLDFAVLTDHDESMAGEEFADLFLPRGDDERVGGASRIHCDGGHDVLVFVGGENDLMPIMIDDHPAGTAGERAAVYNGNDPATAAAFRQLGGLVVIPHSEHWTAAEVAALDAEGMEIYNIHANIDPDIRADHLDLPAGDGIQAALQFTDTSPEGPEPDLALLSFLEPNRPALAIWDELLGQGRRIFGTTGCDGHQNTLPITLRDGERGDSFRRMIRWATNIVLVGDPADPAAVEAAVAAGQSFVLFELFGTPLGFDVLARSGSDDIELGGELEAGAGATLEVAVPTLHAPDPALPAPAIRARILRVDGSGTRELAAGPGPTLSAPIDEPGAYRVEVAITPLHHGPRLGNLGTAYSEREQVWIYTNPIYAR